MAKQNKRADAGIIVPVLNQRISYLKRALLSLKQQTVPIEVVIVTSPDTRPNVNTVVQYYALAEKAELICQTRPGFAAAVNEGISILSTQRFGLLLSDDWLEPDAVERCLRLDGDIVSTGIIIHDKDGVPVAKRIPTREKLRLMEHPWQIANSLTHLFLFNRELVVSAGMLDETIGDSPGVDDFDLIWTLLEHSASIAVTGHPLYHYTDHPGERLTLRNPHKMLETFERILEKHHVPESVRWWLRRDHGEWFGTEIIPKMRWIQSQL